MQRVLFRVPPGASAREGLAAAGAVGECASRGVDRRRCRGRSGDRGCALAAAPPGADTLGASSCGWPKGSPMHIQASGSRGKFSAAVRRRDRRVRGESSSSVSAGAGLGAGALYAAAPSSGSESDSHSTLTASS